MDLDIIGRWRIEGVPEPQNPEVFLNMISFQQESRKKDVVEGGVIIVKEVSKIKKGKISEVIANRIKQMIEEGEFSLNERLPTEKELCEIFGVGRSSIREALIILSSAEIIETKQGEGAFIRKTDLQSFIHPLALSMVSKREQVIHLMEIREMVEIGAVQLAAIRADKIDLLKMKKAMMDYELEYEDIKLRKEHDFTFHQTIAHATKNPILIKFMENISGLIVQSIEYSISQNKGIYSERKQDVLVEHQSILDCIERKDQEEAKKAMKKHFKGIHDKLVYFSD